ncbi:hypothetical protein ACVIYL_004422 [Bradyrhizobium sp. USDA 3315]
MNPATFAGQSRSTLPVAQRLEQLLAIDPRPLTTARPGNSRAPSNMPGLFVDVVQRSAASRRAGPHPVRFRQVLCSASLSRSLIIGCANTGTGVRGAGSWSTLNWTNYTAASSSSISNPSTCLAQRTLPVSRRGSCADPSSLILHSLATEAPPACSSPASTWRAICWPLPRSRPRHGTRGARRVNRIVHWKTQLCCYVIAWRNVVKRAPSKMRRCWALHPGKGSRLWTQCPTPKQEFLNVLGRLIGYRTRTAGQACGLIS